jgi:hypothetical protein
VGRAPVGYDPLAVDLPAVTFVDASNLGTRWTWPIGDTLDVAEWADQEGHVSSHPGVLLLSAEGGESWRTTALPCPLKCHLGGQLSLALSSRASNEIVAFRPMLAGLDHAGPYRSRWTPCRRRSPWTVDRGHSTHARRRVRSEESPCARGLGDAIGVT